MRFLLAVGLFCNVVSAQQPSDADPERRLWNSIREQLTGPDADNYFNSSMKDAQLPALRGKLARRDSQFETVLDVMLPDSSGPEVSIRLTNGAVKYVDQLRSGASLAFSGVAMGFTKTPFHVSFEVDDAQPPIASLGALASDWYLGPDQGTVRTGRYRQTAPGLEFDLPADWSAKGPRPATSGGNVVLLINPRFENATAAVWIERHRIQASEISGGLQKLMTDIAAQRPDLAHYAVRRESVRTTWIGSCQAIQAIADFQSGTGQAMSEALTGVVTENASVVFFARTSADQLEELQASFDRLVYSATLR